MLIIRAILEVSDQVARPDGCIRLLGVLERVPSKLGSAMKGRRVVNPQVFSATEGSAVPFPK